MFLAIFFEKRGMPFEFIQIPANGQGSAKEELSKLLRGGRIASVGKEFVSDGEDPFRALCIEFLEGTLGMDKSRSSGPKIALRRIWMRPWTDYERNWSSGASKLGNSTCSSGSVWRAAQTTGAGWHRHGHGTEPEASRSHPHAGCDKMTKRPPGAGRPVDAGSKAPGRYFRLSRS